MEIKKIQGRIDGVKLLVVPKKSEIQIGDYCKIIKIPNEDKTKSKLDFITCPNCQKKFNKNLDKTSTK